MTLQHAVEGGNEGAEKVPRIPGHQKRCSGLHDSGIAMEGNSCGRCEVCQGAKGCEHKAERTAHEIAEGRHQDAQGAEELSCGEHKRAANARVACGHQGLAGCLCPDL